nr:hypothetical protein [uncultured Ottowia sp.]
MYSSGSLSVSRGFSASTQARAGQVLEALERNAWRLKEVKPRAL